MFWSQDVEDSYLEPRHTEGEKQWRVIEHPDVHCTKDITGIVSLL